MHRRSDDPPVRRHHSRLRRRDSYLLLSAPLVLFLLLVVALVLTTPALPAGPGTLQSDSTKILDRYGRLLYELADPGAGQRTWLPLAEVPLHLRQATIAVEDRSFYDNPGVDLAGIARALVENLREGRIVAGGSTITQQLARNALLDPGDRFDLNVWRKVRESFLALRLTYQWSKDQILEAYLNTVPYGSYSLGVEAAAQIYFGKHARDLDLAEASLIAGLPQAPSRYNPLADLSAARRRQREVLDLMQRAGLIDVPTAVGAAAEVLRFAPRAFPIEAPHFVDAVREVMLEALGADDLGRRGWRVYTTLDLNLQRAAEDILRRHVASLKAHEVSNGALVAIEPETGRVLALVGSADYFDQEIAGAVDVTRALRQPGSALKPFVYALAFEHGFTPASVVADVRTAFQTPGGEPYAPENYDRAWHGPVTLRAALANSYNLPAVKLLKAVGVPSLVGRAQAAGLATLGSTDANLSLALGGGEVRLLDLTAAYGVFANGGTYRAPTFVLRVVDAAGRVVYEPPVPPERQVFSPQIAYLVADILSDNAARRPAFGEYSPLRLSRPAAAKTGTTTDWRDNWTIGFTPDLLAGVWVGNSDNRPTRGISGVAGAAPIWHDFMVEALKAVPPRSFPEPPGLVRAEVCPLSGNRPSEWCPERREELFLAGTVLADTCSIHRPVEICLPSGAPATAECPPDKVVTRVYAQYPPELVDWARERGVPDLPALPATGSAVGPRQPGASSPPTSAPDPRLPSSRPGVPPAAVARSLSIVLASPDPGAVLQLSPALPQDVQRLELAAVASGDVSRVEFYAGDSLLATLSARPYRHLWPLAPGVHTFRAVAHSAAGERVASQPVSVMVVK